MKLLSAALPLLPPPKELLDAPPSIAALSLASAFLVPPAIVPCLLVLAIALAVVYLFIVSPAAGGNAVGFLSSPSSLPPSLSGVN